MEDKSELEEQLSGWSLRRLPLPYEAAFLAGKAFLTYRKRGGSKRSPLPEFYIGAHAQTAGLTSPAIPPATAPTSHGFL